VILVCGAGGEVGGRIVRGLCAAGQPVRALVRPGSAAAPLREAGAEPALGDFRDVDSLRRAVAGVTTVVSTVTVISRALAGDKDADFRRVDRDGHQALITAAEGAGVERFVFVSATRMRVEPTARLPLGEGKIATEERLFGSALREVVLRPDQFQEIWLSPVSQFDWPRRKVVVFGKGETPSRYVATDDVAEAAVRLTLAGDPPRVIEFGGPDALTRKRAVELFAHTLGEPIARRHVPRAAIRLGIAALRRSRPALASVLGGALTADLHPATWGDGPLRDLEIRPRSVQAYADAVTRSA
jgi:NADH dehydrogenase